MPMTTEQENLINRTAELKKLIAKLETEWGNINAQLAAANMQLRSASLRLLEIERENRFGEIDLEFHFDEDWE